MLKLSYKKFILVKLLLVILTASMLFNACTNTIYSKPSPNPLKTYLKQTNINPLDVKKLNMYTVILYIKNNYVICDYLMIKKNNKIFKCGTSKFLYQKDLPVDSHCTQFIYKGMGSIKFGYVIINDKKLRNSNMVDLCFDNGQHDISVQAMIQGKKGILVPNCKSGAFYYLTLLGNDMEYGAGYK